MNKVLRSMDGRARRLSEICGSARESCFQPRVNQSGWRAPAVFLILLPAVLFLISVDCRAQTAPLSNQAKPDQQSESQLLAALLEEVRRLRLALTENGLLQHRSNLLLARVR